MKPGDLAQVVSEYIVFYDTQWAMTPSASIQNAMGLTCLIIAKLSIDHKTNVFYIICNQHIGWIWGDLFEKL